MSKTIATLVYNTYSQEKDVVVLKDLAGDSDQISYKRTAPKRIKDFPGMAKTEVKHTLTGTEGELVGLITVSTSIRADATQTQRDHIMATCAGVVADSAFAPLVNDGLLPYNV